jgi:hypothetical protein
MRNASLALRRALALRLTNFAEWYFPQRLSLDLAAVGGARVPEDGYQAAAGLRAFDGALIDAPILAIGAALVPATEYEALRGRVAAVGPGRPASGATRDGAAGFLAFDAVGFEHLDPVLGADLPDNPIPGAIEAFLLANTAPGEVAISFP